MLDGFSYIHPIWKYADDYDMISKMMNIRELNVKHEL